MSDLFNYYPQQPGFKRRDTAEEAAIGIASGAPRLRQLCLDMLARSGAMTADECASRLGIDKLSIRPRFSELANLSKIADTGQRRLNSSGKRAIVWSLVPERLAA